VCTENSIRVDHVSESPTLAVWAYVVLPLGAAWLVFAIGFPLGFFSSGIFSGLAVYLAELYPTELRGAGQGFGYNIGGGLALSGRQRSASRRRISG
jgi:MFS family permease